LPDSFCALVLVAAGGCTGIRQYIGNGFKVGPNYGRPPAPVADEWIDSTSPRLSTGPPDDRAWWTVFHDPTLDRLVATAYQQSIRYARPGFASPRPRPSAVSPRD
jgi:hypothetical protein